MANADEIFQEYVQMRKNGLEPKDTLKTLRIFVETLSKPAKEMLAVQMRAWERTHLESRTTEVVLPIPEPPERVKPPQHQPNIIQWIECHNCGKKNRINEVFCYSCGQLLDSPLSIALETRQFADATDQLFTDEYFGDESIMALIVRDTQVNFEMRPQLRRHEMVVGRSSNAGTMSPDVDLTDADGAMLGVSRLHLAVRYEPGDNAIQVNDLGSANGTFINGQRLHPKEVRILRSGDELRLGRLVLRVRYQHPGEAL